MLLPFLTFGAEWACRIVNSPAGPVGWPTSFPRKRVGGAPGLLATETEKIERDSLWTDERKRNAGNQALACAHVIGLSLFVLHPAVSAVVCLPDTGCRSCVHEAGLWQRHIFDGLPAVHLSRRVILLETDHLLLRVPGSRTVYRISQLLNHWHYFDIDWKYTYFGSHIKTFSCSLFFLAMVVFAVIYLGHFIHLYVM